jgi:TolB protein
MQKRFGLAAAALTCVLVLLGAVLPPATVAQSSTQTKIAFISDRDGPPALYIMDADGSNVRLLSSEMSDPSHPAWSRDGKLLAVSSVSGGKEDIYVMNADGSGPRRLTRDAGRNIYPTWSPDGKQLGFASNRDGSWDVYVMYADGSNARRITTGPGLDEKPAWSPDGTRIAFMSDRDGYAQVYTVKPDGTDLQRISTARAVELNPAWSPDGRTLAFNVTFGRNFDVFLMDVTGTNRRRLVDSPASDERPVWSPDGKGITFYSERDGNWEVYAIDADGSNERRLTNSPGYDGMPAWQPSASQGAASPPQIPGSGSRTFAETNMTVTGIFLDYWDQHGGLPQQGYPISGLLSERSELDGKTYTVQYFERAVFEHHPDNRPPFDVLLSQLGTFRYKEKYPNGASNQRPNATPGSLLIPETGKRLGGRFLQYWREHGGLAQQGYPISNEFAEVSDLDGRSYTVQYFERAVFELHPENPPPFDVLLSQLGTLRYRDQK